jgi:DNA-binding CsgD family transcriptional regulator
MELKVSALLVHGLATKEMSTYLSISVDAISKHRLSIRKKLGLSREDTLTSQLAKHLNGTL